MVGVLTAIIAFCWLAGRNLKTTDGPEENIVACFLAGWMVFAVLFLQWMVY